MADKKDAYNAARDFMVQWEAATGKLPLILGIVRVSLWKVELIKIDLTQLCQLQVLRHPLEQFKPRVSPLLAGRLL